MDATVISKIITTVFGDNATAFQLALTRLRLQAELVQINSKIAVVQSTANKASAAYGVALSELSVALKAKQAEIDALEAK